jgi:hypothetical protein
MTKTTILVYFIVSLFFWNRKETKNITRNTQQFTNKQIKLQKDNAVRNLYARIELSELQITMLKKNKLASKKMIESISIKAISYQKNDNPPQ